MASREESRSDRCLFEAEAYYRDALGPEAQQSFKDLDNAASLEDLLQNVRSCGTQNFVLDFSDIAARVAFDLQTSAIEGLINTERPESLNTRWINIWYPQYHESLIELLAKRYDFSPRLLGLMVSDPEQPNRLRYRQAEKKASNRKFVPRRFQQDETQVEKGTDDISELSIVSSEDSVTKGNLYNIIDDMWNYSSIDFGRSYVCIGYNSLYPTKTDDNMLEDSRLPRCKRSWTWLLLCEDHTVISITEDPFPYSRGDLDLAQYQLLAETRRNLVNVFRSLSSAEEGPSTTRKPLAMFPIRVRLGRTREETAHRLSDTPGLLFYYLFENWHNSYTLITRRESRYGSELKNLRAEMFSEPKLCHIDRLDNISSELGVLKHHFESYTRIIERLLEPRTITNASLQNYRVNTESSQASLDTVRQVVNEQESTLGVSLSSPARVRFDRLKDLIDLYALTEFEEFIKQTDSLVAMNLQLITIKESLDVERLTRITLFLTKLTIVFLPVNLITAYFAVPLQTVSYTLKDYWITFVIVMILSWSALFVFGVFSGTLQTIPFWTATKDAGRWIRNHL